MSLADLRRAADTPAGEACNRLGEYYLKHALPHLESYPEPQCPTEALKGEFSFWNIKANEAYEYHFDEEDYGWVEARAARAYLDLVCREAGPGEALRRHGEWRNRELRTAFEWFQRAADLGDPEGMWNLGWRYWLGEGVAPDQAEAARWWKEAAARGHAAAREKLASL
jgi:TPR repeat protein